MGVVLFVDFVEVVDEHNVLLRVSKCIAPTVKRLSNPKRNQIRRTEHSIFAWLLSYRDLIRMHVGAEDDDLTFDHQFGSVFTDLESAIQPELVSEHVFISYYEPLVLEQLRIL